VYRYIKKINTRYKLKKETENLNKRCDIDGGTLLNASLSENLAVIKESLGESPDVIIREFKLGGDGVSCALIMIDGLSDKELADLAILKPLMYNAGIKFEAGESSDIDIDIIIRNYLSSNETSKILNFGNVIDDILSGNAVLLLDGAAQALSIGIKKWEKRSIEAPKTETVVRGPTEGFTETLRVNTSLIRRRIKSPDFRMEALKIGKQTKTDVCLIYIKNIVMPGLLEEVKKRLNAINTDSILDSGYIEAYIEDAPLSIFSTVGNSERPDTVAARLLEGRIAIVVDGSPFILTVPMVFMESFQSAEDYYIRPYFATFLRFIRVLCYFITLLAPALYVALTTYHQEFLPTKLLFTMTAGLSGVPFPALVEALLMVIIFDILKEAGIRLPKPIGSAVSIVGALVIGQSAVTAGLIGPFMVIVVSITAIANFVVPSQSDSITIMRYIFLILAAALGAFGIALGILFILIYLVSLKSFGVQYLSPIMPFYREEMKDCFVRMPLWSMIKRPFQMTGKNIKRRSGLEQKGNKT
jgi:spore germination protein KA